MAHVKLALEDLTPAQLADKGDDIVVKMTGNGNFATPDPTLGTVTSATSNIRLTRMALR